MSSQSAGVQARSAYTRARRKAFLHGLLSTMQGHTNDLMAYDEVRRTVKAGMPNYRGITQVPLDRIVGSVNRYRDFDRAFLPTQGHTRSRWRRVGEAFYADINLPPVTLYKVGEVYFVVDGNHRVSVARELGREFIDAEVLECQVRVPITPDMDPDDITVMGEKTAFLDATHLDESEPVADFTTTIPGGYYLLIEHVEYHRYMQSQEWNREFSLPEAATQWYDRVYLPVVKVIRETGVMREFSGRTETDLYLWVIEHQYYLREHLGEQVSMQDAASSFARHFTPNLLKRAWNWLVEHITPSQSEPPPPTP
jgi:uncharacterized ParB-like nuclease family protein